MSALITQRIGYLYSFCIGHTIDKQQLYNVASYVNISSLYVNNSTETLLLKIYNF